MHGIGRKGRIRPWIFFSLMFVGGSGQLITDLSNDEYTTLYKLAFFCNFVNEAVGLFLTVYYRHETTRLCENIFSHLAEEDSEVVKRHEKIICTLLVVFVLALFSTCTVVELLRTPPEIIYVLVIDVPGLNWISYFICKIFGSVYIATLYFNCYIFILLFIGLSLDRFNRFKQLKSLPLHQCYLMMKQLSEMDEMFERFEAHSSLPVFLMIAGHFFEITLFLYRQINSYTSHPQFRILTTFLVVMNIALVAYCIAVVSHFQEKVKNLGRQLIESLRLQPFSVPESLLFPAIKDQIKVVSSQSITALNVVKIDRKLIFALFSSFLTIAVLFIQMDHGALRSGECSCPVSATTH